VEIAVPVTDLGVGVASLSLALEVPNPSAVPGAQATDGTWHFNLPASVVRGREGQLRFSLTATDKLQHTSTIPPGDSTAIWVDDLRPTVMLARVDYANASPARSAVCGPTTDSSTSPPFFVCGRQGATHLLRDDTVKFWFDAYDCGVGMAAQGQQSATVKSGGLMRPAAFSTAGTNAGPCVSGNPTHRYTFTLNVATMAPALDPPDASGTAVVQLISTAVDRCANAAQSVGATSGDGLALVSLWRWKTKLPGDATGSPALLLGAAGSREVAIGTNAPTTGGGNNFFVLKPDGSQDWAAQITSGVVGDVAVGSEAGLVYAMSASPATISFVPAPPAQVSSCAGGSSTTFGNPPVITTASSSEVAVVASTAHSGLGYNLFVFKSQGACPLSQTLITGTDFTGATAMIGAPNGTVFLSNTQGFTSIAQNGNGFDTTTGQAAYNPTVSALAPPSISIPTSVVNAIFGGAHNVRRSVKATCGALSSPCWTTDLTYNGSNAGFTTNTALLPFTPVFDGTTIWSADDQGVVYTWRQDTGVLLKSIALGAAVSSPVLLGVPPSGPALIVHNDGSVEILTLTTTTPSLTALTLVNVGAFAASVTPVPPAIDFRGAGGVAYVPAPQGWVYALQIPQAPMSASASVWPRPGRDSCNSRSAGSSCL
jgi:hypothetical protein